MDIAPWLSVLRELGFTAVAGFLIWCLVKVIWWLLSRNAALSDQILKVVERNTDALESLKHTLKNRPCLAQDEVDTQKNIGGENRGDRG